MCGAGPVEQAGVAFGTPAGEPFVSGSAGHAQFLDHVRDRAAIGHDTLDEQASSVQGQPGITVGHRDLRVGESVATSTSLEVFSLIKPPRRVNNAHGQYI